MYILRVETYKNAVKIFVYKNGNSVSREIIKLRWWQRKKASRIIDTFYLDNITEFYNKAVEWQLNEHPQLTWDFEKHTIK